MSNLNVVKVSDSRQKVVFSVSAAEFDVALDKAFEIVNKDVKIDGFRKGKASKQMFLNKFGVESLYEEALNQLFNDKAREIYADEEVAKKVISQFTPEVESKDFGQGKDFEISLSFDVIPDFQLPKYKGVEVAKPVYEATEEEIIAAVKAVAKAHSTTQVKDGAISSGDIAKFDFEGKVDGVAFEGGSAKDYELQIGSGQFIPGFEDQMIGMKKDETKDLNVKFPENYQAENLAGKDAVFSVTVHEIKEEIIPDITDDFVKSLKLEGIESVDALKASKKTEIEDKKKTTEKDKEVDTIINTILDNAKVEVPQSMITERYNQMRSQYENQAKMYNIPFETFLSFMGTDEKTFEENVKKQAERNALFNIVMQKIIEVEKLDPTKEEIEARALKDVETSKLTKEQLIQQNLNSYYSEIAYNKLIDLLVSNAVEK